jgi:chemotaxis protein methyltransferase WspC
LIYLDTDSSNQALNCLASLLKQDGILFVGSSETGKINPHSWQSLRQPFTFAYRQKAPIPAQKLEVLPVLPPPLSRPSVTLSDKDRLIANFDLGLAESRSLADEGKVKEAQAQCSQYIKNHPTCAEAHALLGILYQSQGQNSAAEEALQKALYLNPNCYEALVHLALLKENRGDQSGAAIFRRRIQKLQSPQS